VLQGIARGVGLRRAGYRLYSAQAGGAVGRVKWGPHGATAPSLRADTLSTGDALSYHSIWTGSTLPWPCAAGRHQWDRRQAQHIINLKSLFVAIMAACSVRLRSIPQGTQARRSFRQLRARIGLVAGHMLAERRVHDLRVRGQQGVHHGNADTAAEVRVRLRSPCPRCAAPALMLRKVAAASGT